jgi:hypothetical protein
LTPTLRESEEAAAETDKLADQSRANTVEATGVELVDRGRDAAPAQGLKGECRHEILQPSKHRIIASTLASHCFASVDAVPVRCRPSPCGMAGISREADDGT